MKPFIKITQYTIVDQMRHKSFYVLLAICLGFIFLIRGCYSGNYMINGQQVDNIASAWIASRIVFQVIVMGMLLMVSMISMKIFRRDQKDGSVHMFLSRPVNRWEYVLGRIVGTWLFSSCFMLLLHLAIFLIVWFNTNEMIIGYLLASLVCSVNLLFMISAVCLFSLFMPDFISAMFAIGLVFTGFISDGGFKLLSFDAVKAFAPSIANTDPSLWRIFFPKLFMVQVYGDSIICQKIFMGIGPVHPFLNVFIFIVLLVMITLFIFSKKEI